MRKLLILGASFAAFIVALVALAFYLSLSSDGDPEQLRALKADPMARHVPPGARLIDRFETEDGKAIGKTTFAGVYREFEFPRGAVDGAVAAAARAARAAGWTADERASDEFVGEKRSAPAAPG